jgi:hypothetical protein
MKKQTKKLKATESEPNTHQMLQNAVESKNKNPSKKLRPTSEGGHCTFDDQVEASVTTNITPIVVQWLESRKKSVPAALNQKHPPTDMDTVLRLLPDLRERERRALIRKVEKELQNNGEGKRKQDLEGSDDEYCESHNEADNNQTLSDKWPSTVQFSNSYEWDASVPQNIKNKYCPCDGPRNRNNRLSKKVYFKRITDTNHPACGEYGLFCALPDGAAPGTWLLDYVGRITLGENQDIQSDYVSDFGEHSELACDANTFGNEARFLNDFRNTGNHPNVEFNFRRDKHGELRQGVYVKLKKDSKVEGFDGVKQHEELLVSYGKSYWRSRHSDLTDFVYRYPGQQPADSKCK